MQLVSPVDVVEQWARVSGYVMHSRTGYDRNWKGRGWGIHVNPLPPHGTLLICEGGDELRGIEVSPAVALAWATRTAPPSGTR
jgi:hypothetical protein